MKETPCRPVVRDAAAEDVTDQRPDGASCARRYSRPTVRAERLADLVRERLEEAAGTVVPRSTPTGRSCVGA